MRNSSARARATAAEKHWTRLSSLQDDSCSAEAVIQAFAAIVHDSCSVKNADKLIELTNLPSARDKSLWELIRASHEPAVYILRIAKAGGAHRSDDRLRLEAVVEREIEKLKTWIRSNAAELAELKRQVISECLDTLEEHN